MKNHYKACRVINIIISIILASLCFTLSVLFVFQQSVNNQALIKLIEMINKYFFLSINASLLSFSIVFMIVFGIPELLVTFTLLARKKFGFNISFATSIVFIIVSLFDVFIIPEYLVSIPVLFLAISQLIISILGNIEFYKYHFSFNIDSYKNIGKQKDNIVLYYKENDFILKHAYYVADLLHANISEIKVKHNENEKIDIYKDNIELEEVNLELNEVRSIHILINVKNGKMALPCKEILNLANSFNKKLYLEIVSNRLYTVFEIKKMFKNVVKQPYKAISTNLRYGIIVDRKQVI